MKRLTFLSRVILFSLFSSIGLIAQTVVTTGPVTINDRLAWSNPSNVPLSDANSFEYRLRDGSFIPVTALTNVQCVAGTPVTCTASLTQSNVDALNMIGVHNLTLTLYRADVGESPTSSPFLLTSPAGAPINLRLIR